MEAVEPGHVGTPDMLTLPIVWAQIFAENNEIEKIDNNLMVRNFRVINQLALLKLIFLG